MRFENNSRWEESEVTGCKYDPDSEELLEEEEEEVRRREKVRTKRETEDAADL